MDASSTPTGAVGAESEYGYWAFISYSHQDEQWAQWLHTSLETYPIPKALRNRIAALGPDGPVDRLFPVVRDRDELGGGFDLNDLNDAVRWLNRSESSPSSTQGRVAIQRLLGHPVLDLGDAAVTKATQQWTFSASETLYGLSSIPPPHDQAAH